MSAAAGERGIHPGIKRPARVGIAQPTVRVRGMGGDRRVSGHRAAGGTDQCPAVSERDRDQCCSPGVAWYNLRRAEQENPRYRAERRNELHPWWYRLGRALQHPKLTGEGACSLASPTTPKCGRAPGPSPAGHRGPRRRVRLPRYAFVGAGLGRRSGDQTRLGAGLKAEFG
jgi:hypothetical protein